MMRPRSLAAATAAALLALLTIGVAATPASAHDRLQSSSPAAGAVVADAPTEVRLDFSDAVLDLGGVVVVADADGRDWADGPLSISRGTVTQKLRPGAPAGAYQIRWRVVSADGHPISDVVDYSVGDRALAPLTRAGAGSTGAPGSIGSTPGPTSTAAAAPPARTGDEEGGGMPAGLVFAGLAVGGAAVGIGAYALITILIRRRTTA